MYTTIPIIYHQQWLFKAGLRELLTTESTLRFYLLVRWVLTNRSSQLFLV
jgi:hypothetical protein